MRVKYYFALALIATLTVSAQQIRPQKVEAASPGKAVVLELVGNIGRDDAISWRTIRGQGKIEVSTDPRKITFFPEGPTDTIIVVCVISPRRGSRKEVSAEIKLVSPGPTPPAPEHPKPPANPPQQGVPNQARPAQPNPEGLVDQLGFLPAGFMGSAQEGSTVELNQGWTDQPHSEPSCVRIAYEPQTSQDSSLQSRVPWFAIAWQFTDSEPNWGDLPGRNLDEGKTEESKYRSLRIWAKGAPRGGRPPIAQFKSGGGTKRNLPTERSASYEVVGPFRPLNTDWTEYCLDLSGKKLTNVVSAFTIVMERSANPNGAVVFLDDIHFSQRPCSAGR